ncbi:hypothetical protein D3C71_1576690 [compost metagenome]
MPAATPPEAEAEQGGAGQKQGAELPAPQGFAVGAGLDRRRAGRGVDHQARVGRHVQRAGRQAAVFQMVFEGVPPDHVDGGQLDGAGPCRHQGLAVFTAADQAAFAVLVAEHRLIRVAAQPADIGAGQRWQLAAGQAFGRHRQAAGQ